MTPTLVSAAFAHRTLSLQCHYSLVLVDAMSHAHCRGTGDPRSSNRSDPEEAHPYDRIEERALRAPSRSLPRADMTAMTIIVLMIVFWTLFVVGVLIGMSVHREATRRRVHRLDLEEY